MNPNQEALSDNQANGNNSPFDGSSGSDFLSELFDLPSHESELNHAKYFLSSDYQEIVEDLMDGGVNPSCDNLKSYNIKKKKNYRKDHGPLFANLSKENNELKHTNQQLKKKNITQERSIANYEVKLARCMTDLLAAKKELEESKKANKSYEIENANLKLHVNQIEGELSQYKRLKLRNDEENQKILELEKTISVQMESIKRLKKNSAAYRLQLAEKDALLKKLRHHNKQISGLLVEFGYKLTEAGLLTKNYSMDVLQKYQEEYSTLKTSEDIGENDDFPQITSGILMTSLRHKEQVDDDNFDSSMGDQNVSSSVASPPPSSISSSGISSSTCKNIDSFQTQLHNLPKKKNKSQKKLSESNDESNILEVEDLQIDSSAKDGKDFHKISDDISTTISKECIPQSCIGKFSNMHTYLPKNNQNINFSLSSSVSTSRPKGEEVTSSNINLVVPFPNGLINNKFTMQDVYKKKLSQPSLSDETELDKCYEFSPEAVSHDEEIIDPDEKLGSTLCQRQNFYISQEEKMFRSAQVSSCDDILIPLTKSKIPAQEENIKPCIGQISSISTSIEKEFLPSISLDPQHEEHNCFITSESVLKNNTTFTQSPLNKLRKQFTNESDISDSTLQKISLENEITTFDSVSNDLELGPDFEKTTSLLQEEQSLSENKSIISDEFSKFESVLNMLLNPISPLAPSPIKNSISFNNDSILSSKLEETREDPLTSQLSLVSKSVKNRQNDQFLYAKDDWSGTSVSHESFVLESHEDLKYDTKHKFVEQCNSFDGSIVNPLICDEQNVTSNITFPPKTRECYVSLSTCDIPNYFSSVRKKSSSQMLAYNQNNCKSCTPDCCNLISSCKTNDLVLVDSDYKTATNVNKIPDFYKNSSQLKAKDKRSLSQEFSADNLACKSQHDISIKRPLFDSLTEVTATHSSLFNMTTSLDSIVKDSSVDAVLDCKFSSNNHCDLIESENSSESSSIPDFIFNTNASISNKDHSACFEMENSNEFNSSNSIINEASSLNMMESFKSRKQNNLNKSLISQTQECYVSLSRNDIPNYLRSLRNRTPSQIVDYYNNNLTNSVLRNSNSVSLFGSKDNKSVSHDDCVLSAQMKCSANMKNKFGIVSNTSDLEIFFKKDIDSNYGFLKKLSDLPKINTAAPFFSSQSLSAPSNTIDSLCLTENLCVTEHENHYKPAKGLEKVSKDLYLSNIMTPTTRRKGISNAVVSENSQECYVSLSRNDIPNYFLSMRKKHTLQASENNQVNFSNLMTNVSDLFTSSKQEKSAELVTNDYDDTSLDTDMETNVDCNSFHNETNEIGINTAISTDIRSESNSCISYGILCDKSSNLLKEKTLALPNERDQLTSCFNIAKNSFESQSLPSSYVALFHDNDTSDRIKSVDKKLTVSVTQDSSGPEIGHKNSSAVYAELQISNLNQNSKISFKPQYCPFLKSRAPSSDSNTIVYGIKPVDEELTVSQISSGGEIHHELLSSDPTELPIHHFNQNLVKPSKSENCSLNVTAFQNSSDTEIFHDDLCADAVKFPIETQYQKCSKKRKRLNSFKCNISKKTSLKNWCNDFNNSKPLCKKRSTLLLPGPSMSTKWKKSSILNRDPLPGEQKRVQTEVPIPKRLSAEFQKKCSSVIEKQNSSKIKRKPLHSGMAWVAPVRLRGRTSKSKVFFKISSNKHINNVSDSNSVLNKETEISLMTPAHEKNTENYVSVKLPKMRKQFKKKASSEVHVFSNISTAASNLFEQPFTSQDENQLDATPEQSKPNTSSKIFFDFLQNYASAEHKFEDIQLQSNPIVQSKDVINRQLSINKIENKLENEKSSFDNIGLNGGLKFKPTMHKIEQSKELINQLHGNENKSHIKNDMPETPSLNAGGSNRSFNRTSFLKREKLKEGYETSIDATSNKNEGCTKDFHCRKKAYSDSMIQINHSSSEDFMKNSFSNVPCSATKMPLNSLEQPISVLTDLQISKAKPTPEHLWKSKQITATNVLFDFLQKQNSTKHKIDSFKKIINKQLPTNKTENKLKKESKRQSINETKSKLKNKSNNLLVSKSKSKLKTVSTKVFLDKSENKLKDENKSLSVKQNKSKSKLKYMKKRRLKAKNLKIASKSKIHKLKSNKEITPTISSPLSDVLHGIESIQIIDEQFKQYIHSLTNFLTNPLHAPDMTSLIYHVVDFLYLTRENDLINSSKNDSEYCLPNAETCIVEALFSIQNDSNLQMQCLTKTVLHILHQLVLTKIKFNINGLASLCRVLAEICKRTDDKDGALSLCCNILKVKHPFGPFLIASIVAVWKQLFMMSDSMPEEEILLLRSISFGVHKRPPRLSKSNWNFSFQFLTGLVPSIPDAFKAIEFLKNRILIKCLENTFEELWRLTSPFLILVAEMPWDWIKMHILDMYIIPNLQRFSRHVSKEEAFDLFCNLCVEVLLLNPELDENNVLNMFYENLSLTGRNFVRECVAVSLMKYFILSKRTVPPFLEDWFKNNQDNTKVQVFKNIFHQRLLSEHQELLTKEDIVI